MTALEIDTPHGPARAHLQPAPSSPRVALVLGHGAGGGVAAPDLVTAAGAGHDGGLFVVLVEQPYRVAGRRSVAPTHQLDAAWVAVVADLVAGPLAGLQLITGGRSSGARVACRTAAETGTSAVLCLAFPLHPPSRKPAAERKTRQPELDAVDVPTLVVQGASDPFGLPAAGPRRQVVTVPGNHGLRAHQDQIGAAIRAWLAELELELGPAR